MSEVRQSPETRARFAPELAQAALAELRVYDSLRQDKVEFAPRDTGHVTMYFCGPTVYNYIHLGNARPFVISLVAKRFFESLGWGVTLVENITDIDDRIIAKGNQEGRSWKDVAEEFSDAYVEDTQRLGLGRPDIEPRATEHIPEILELIGKLVERKHAYAAAGDVYFDVSSFTEYGKLSKQQTGEMRSGARIAPDEDKHDPGLRRVEGGQAGRALLGFALGTRPPRLAYRVLCHEPQVPGRRLRHPWRRPRSDLSPSRERGGAVRGRAG